MVSVAAGVLRGQESARFVGLGGLSEGVTRSTATDISADGRVVVGSAPSGDGTQSFRWDDGVMTPLEELPGGRRFSVARGISADGTIVAGVSDGETGMTVVRWVGDSIHPVDENPGEGRFIDAFDLSADGEVIVGARALQTDRLAASWRGGTLRDLGRVRPDLPSSQALATSSNGAVIVGYGFSSEVSEAFLYDKQGMHRLHDLPGGKVFSLAMATSADGLVAAGHSESVWGMEPFRWSGGRMEGLGGLSQENFGGTALDVNADGSVIVGMSTDDGHARLAFVWTADHGMRRLSDVLVGQFGLRTPGWRLEEAIGISDDGLAIVGNGRNPDGHAEAWLVRLPPKAWTDPGSANVSSDGEVGEARRFRFGRWRTSLDGIPEPDAVAVDRDGNVAVAGRGDPTIRWFDARGAVLNRDLPADTPLRVGSRAAGLAFAKDGLLYLAEAAGNRIVVLNRDLTPARSWGRRGTSAGEFNEPRGVAVSDEHVFVADSGNRRVQVFDLMGQPVRVIDQAGPQDGAFRNPTDVAVDAQGQLWVAETGRSRIHQFDAEGRWLRSWGEPGSGTNLFGSHVGLCAFGGELFVADQAIVRVDVRDGQGKRLTDWGAMGVRPHEGGGRLMAPRSIAIAPDGSFGVVCETLEDRCQIFERASAAESVRPAEFRRSIAPEFGPRFAVSGNLLAVAEPNVAGVAVYDLAVKPAALLSRFGVYGSRPGEFLNPSSVLLDAEASRLAVVDAGNSRITLLEVRRPGPKAPPDSPGSCRFVKSIALSALDTGGAESKPDRPLAIAALARHPHASVYVVDERHAEIRVFDSEWKLVRRFGEYGEGDKQLRKPVDLAFDGSGGRVYVADEDGRRVQVFTSDGQHQFSIGPETGDYRLGRPCAVAAGPDGSVFVVDGAGDCVVKFGAQGEGLARWGRRGGGPGEFLNPTDIAVDAIGRVFVLDTGNRRVQVLSAQGRFVEAIGPELYTRMATDAPKQ